MTDYGFQFQFVKTGRNPRSNFKFVDSFIRTHHENNCTLSCSLPSLLLFFALKAGIISENLLAQTCTDFWQNHLRQRCSLIRKMFLKSAKVEIAPGDGSCLYHSLSFNLKHEKLYSDDGFALRRHLNNYIKENLQLQKKTDVKSQ